MMLLYIDLSSAFKDSKRCSPKLLLVEYFPRKAYHAKKMKGCVGCN